MGQLQVLARAQGLHHGPIGVALKDGASQWAGCGWCTSSSTLCGEKSGPKQDDIKTCGQCPRGWKVEHWEEGGL